jgi:hypothetical protein
VTLGRQSGLGLVQQVEATPHESVGHDPQERFPVRTFVQFFPPVVGQLKGLRLGRHVEEALCTQEELPSWASFRSYGTQMLVEL